jgi:hypothetical protein
MKPHQKAARSNARSGQCTNGPFERPTGRSFSQSRLSRCQGSPIGSVLHARGEAARSIAVLVSHPDPVVVQINAQVRHGVTVLFALAITVTFGILGISYGPMASFIPETFATLFRYTGAGLAVNLGGILGGAMPPLVAGASLAKYGSWAIGLMMAVLILISLLSTSALPETRAKAL